MNIKGFLKTGAMLIIGALILTGCGNSSLTTEKQTSAVQQKLDKPSAETPTPTQKSSNSSSKSLSQVDADLEQVEQTIDNTLDSLDQTLDSLNF